MRTPGRQAPDLDPIEREAVAKVQKLTSGEATPDEVEALKRWCAQSPAHEAAFVAAKQIWDKVGAAGRVLQSPDQDFATELDRLGRKRKTINRRAILGGAVVIAAG